MPDRISDPRSFPFIGIDASLCNGCAECIPHCHVSAIVRDEAGGISVDPRKCVNCGQCLTRCEHGAIIETVSSLKTLSDALVNSEKRAVALLSPAAAKTLADSFSCPGAIPHGRIVHALRALGFSYVWDIESGADTAISTEADNLIIRTSRGDTGTVFTTFCPSFEKYAGMTSLSEHATLSGTKTPLALTAAVARADCADKENIPASHVTTVAIMPCVAKKYESLHPRHKSAGKPDIDIVLTVRELAHLLKSRGIDLSEATDHDDDSRPSYMRKEGTRFAESNGVMDCILSTLSHRLKWKTTPRLREKGKIRSASFKINGSEVRVAVADGMAAAGILCGEAARGDSPYDLIEVLACQGGCVNGGGCTVRREKSISSGNTFGKTARGLFPAKKPGECA